MALASGVRVCDIRLQEAVGGRVLESGSGPSVWAGRSLVTYLPKRRQHAGEEGIDAGATTAGRGTPTGTGRLRAAAGQLRRASEAILEDVGTGRRADGSRHRGLGTDAARVHPVA